MLLPILTETAILKNTIKLNHTYKYWGFYCVFINESLQKDSWFLRIIPLNYYEGFIAFFEALPCEKKNAAHQFVKELVNTNK